MWRDKITKRLNSDVLEMNRNTDAPPDLPEVETVQNEDSCSTGSMCQDKERDAKCSRDTKFNLEDTGIKSKENAEAMLNMKSRPEMPVDKTFSLKHAIAKYISMNISQRECKEYVRKRQSEKDVCQCGRSVSWHEDRGMQCTVDKHPDIWNMNTHTKLIPCNSFGEISFRGFRHAVSNAPYVRLDPFTDLETIWTILTELWGLSIPKLLISITGGAKLFDLKPRLRNLLKSGLCHAASSTGAWIITGGTSTGVMKFVGEAVRDHIAATGNTGQSKIVALGIVTWGIISNKAALEGEGDTGLFPATYAVKDGDAPKLSPLDPNHTHFILVDDGTEGKYGAEIELRTKLESYISKKVETKLESYITKNVETGKTHGVRVPNVLIVVEGGPNTMKTVSESIQRNTPIVVIEGSGRAAEYIAAGYKLTKGREGQETTVFPDDFDDVMIRKARAVFTWKKTDTEKTERQINECCQNIRKCLEQRRLINVFNLESADIDRVILYALFKANMSNANSQLALALAWNRCDIAREEIFTLSNRKHWKKVDLYNAMLTALIQNRADFVQLFIDNGLDIKRFLNVSTLWKLYANVFNNMVDTRVQLIGGLLAYHKQSWTEYLCCRWARKYQNSSDLLKDIGKLIMNLLRDQAMQLYSDDKYICEMKDPIMTWVDKEEGFHDQYHFSNPEKELFLWAVLFNRSKMAHLFWRIGKNHIMSAVVACSMLKMMSNEADSAEELELSVDLQQNAALFEKKAFDVLSECYSRDKPATRLLLVCEQKEWGRSTIFRMAASHKMMDIIEHSACQTKLNDIWKGKMALHTHDLKIVITIPFPILLPFMKFTSNSPVVESPSQIEGDSNKGNHPPANPTEHLPDKETPNNTLQPERPKIQRKTTRLVDVNLIDPSSASTSINFLTAIYYFYNAPVTKFYCNMISYLAFLTLFSYFVLIDLYPTSEPNSPSVSEITTWVWVVTMFLEELRRIFTKDQHSLLNKMRGWLSTAWNKFNLLIYILFIVSVSLRFSLPSSTFVWARMSYSLTLGLSYILVMRFFFISKNMGPKVIMIKKTLTDLLFFFFILLVFVASFGVAYHVNMYPNHYASYKVLVNVLYLPYWQMYGELFLDRVEGGDDPAGCSRNETIWRNDLAPRCPEPNGLVTILLAVYMIITNILLVNLLIAMFSYTFQKVQDNSQKIWRFYRLSLVYEYFDRPTLVPPIIIINHVYRAGKWIYKRCCNNYKKSNAFKERLDGKDCTRLRIFENAAVEMYLSRSLRRQRREQLASLLSPKTERPSAVEGGALRQRVDDMSEQLSEHTVKLNQLMEMMEKMMESQLGHSSPR